MEEVVSEYGVKMSEDAVRRYLGSVGDGVLSIGGDVPYGIPVSTAYDPDQDRLVFQLLSGRGSQKKALLDAGTTVCFTAYEWHDIDDWRCVIVPGDLRVLDWADVEREQLLERYVEQTNVTALSVFDKPATELLSEWYELDASAATGRTAPTLDVDDESETP